MKVAVVGAGAIGAYVGAALHRAGPEVHLIARGPHLAAMRRDGVRVLSPRGDFTARPAATDDPSEVGRATMGQICRHPDTRALVGSMMRETLAVAAAVGCRPEISVERRIAGAERVGDHKTSTLQDLERGKPLELDVLLAAVVELADLAGVPVPTLRAAHALADLLATTSSATTATAGSAP
ncbi:ketopantoate reductase family protein [Streptomyces sp. NPDC057582]|uniref:ketopantoate reductase family protein n=1 Tax=Streptomyces sp. NPDC057582 TaxID=3346174 RepID=UPI0036B00E02